MTTACNFVLDRAYAVLIVFTISTMAARVFLRSPAWRFAIGVAGLLLCLCIAVLGRSLFESTVSAVERPSPPGFLLLVVLAISATTGRRVETSAEFRFGTLMIALAGFFLYPASVGFLDYDTYRLGYGGYSLPIAIASIVCYAVYRGYLLTAVALNIAIGLFVLGTGRSFNLWDYVIDPVAWVAAIVASIAIRFFAVEAAANSAPAQPSSGIGETPISH